MWGESRAPLTGDSEPPEGKEDERGASSYNRPAAAAARAGRRLANHDGPFPMTYPLRVFFLLAASLFLGLAPQAQKGTHRDGRIGFELKPPPRWQEIPLQVGESWIVAKYQSDRELQTYEKDKGSWRQKPELTVVAFLTGQIEREDVEENEDEGQRAEVRVRATIPFRDYEEYLKTVRSGFYIEKDVTEQEEGMAVRKLEVKLETMGRPASRLVAWIFPLEVGDVAVEMFCFEDSWDKYEKVFEKVLRSFKPIERTEDLDLASATGGYLSFYFGDLDPEQRRLRRQEAERQLWEQLSSSLPDGWDVDEYDGVKVANHADDKFAKKCAQRVIAVRTWLEDTFPHVGAEEYTRVPILQICADRDEEASFLRGTGFGSNTITTHKDKLFGSNSSEWDYISRRTTYLWFFDKDNDLWLNLPIWLNIGLSYAVGYADVKGKSLDFGTDYFKRAWRELGAEPQPVRSLLAIADEEQAWDTVLQCMALTRFLADSRSRKYRELLPAYVDHVRAIVDEIREEEKDLEKPPKPTNEEEEEAWFAERKERAKARRARILEEAMSRTFAGWDESDWSSFEKDYLKSID